MGGGGAQSGRDEYCLNTILMHEILTNLKQKIKKRQSMATTEWGCFWRGV